ncbi:unnamed protein product [Cylicocyclus nassatus]|uniref:Uncharacterized protein n=1 Tax=Cylicocyclus nassatus TaxID=53992 RepID=A0AA36GXV7_CYLNA|nr:unnamed protein product [Cylicocyclus nassatus]
MHLLVSVRWSQRHQLYACNAALIFTSDGRRMFEVSEELVEVAQEKQLYIVFENEQTEEDEEELRVTVGNDEEDEPESYQPRRRSTDSRDSYGDLMQRIEMISNTYC